MGTWDNKYLGVAAQYLQFLGTDKATSADISKQFYNLASTFNVSAGTEFTTVYLAGLQENFDKTVTAFEDLLRNCKADDEALKKLLARLQKQRADNKLNKSMILNGLNSYALYGAKNPFNYQLTDDELKNLKAQDLVNILHNLVDYKHDIIYYGPQPLATLTPAIARLHKLPAAFTPNPEKVAYAIRQQNNNEVLFANYDMVQAEINWVRNAGAYNVAQTPIVTLFNNYFGAGGMSGVVFQTIRESKALAYSTYAIYNTPAKREDPYTFRAYVGTQADKIHEAIAAMNELVNDLPKGEKLLTDSKQAIRKDIETDRVTDESVIFNYLAAQRLGNSVDTRKAVYTAVDKFTFDDLKKFAADNIAGKPYTYCVVASEKRVNPEELKKYGEVKILTLEQIFGY
jgi:predicted Zn-dependent peptidase